MAGNPAGDTGKHPDLSEKSWPAFGENVSTFLGQSLRGIQLTDFRRLNTAPMICSKERKNAGFPPETRGNDGTLFAEFSEKTLTDING
jgi:hypothetical protein